jgi:hypothetical protein
VVGRGDGDDVHVGPAQEIAVPRREADTVEADAGIGQPPARAALVACAERDEARPRVLLERMQVPGRDPADADEADAEDPVVSRLQDVVSGQLSARAS